MKIRTLLCCAFLSPACATIVDEGEEIEGVGGGDEVASTGGAEATGGSDGPAASTGGSLVGNATGGSSTGGTPSTGGDASGGAMSTGGAATGGAATTGGNAATGGSTATGGAASTGGSSSTGGTAATGGGGPDVPGSECLEDWESQAEASACTEAGQSDRVKGCTNLLNCWQANDCTPTSCAASPDDTCGQNTVPDSNPGKSYAETVYSALCN